MQYNNPARSGLKVGRLALGIMKSGIVTDEATTDRPASTPPVDRCSPPLLRPALPFIPWVLGWHRAISCFTVDSPWGNRSAGKHLRPGLQTPHDILYRLGISTSWI
jgi:hypothetical protein